MKDLVGFVTIARVALLQRTLSPPEFNRHLRPCCYVGSGWRRLLASQAAADRIQIQAILLGHFDRRSHALSQEGRNDDSALLDIQYNRAAGWKMSRNRRPSRGLRF